MADDPRTEESNERSSSRQQEVAAGGVNLGGQRSIGVLIQGPPEQLRINILLDEYRTLRAESLQGIQARHQVVTFTFGALSVVIAGILTSDASPLLLGFIAYVAVPQIAKSALLMWLGEYRRSARAGHGLRAIENRINQLVGEETLTWERTLSSGRTHMTYPYTATVFIVLLVSYISLVIGISQFAIFLLQFTTLLSRFTPTCTIVIVVVTLFALAAIVELLFWRFFLRLWREARVSTYLVDAGS
jgi:hypothetical protein